jgi:hypothetical protein
MRLVERLRRGGMTFEVEERTASPLWSLETADDAK